MDFEDDKSVVLSESEIVSVKGGDSDVEDGLSEVSVDDLEGGEGSEFDEYDEFDDEEAVEYNRKKGGTEINLEEKQYNSDE